MMTRAMQAIGSFKTLLTGASRKLDNCWLRHALIGFGVLIPSLSIAGTVCIEAVFSGGGSTPWFSEETSEWQAPANSLFVSVSMHGSCTDDFRMGYHTLWGYSRTAESAEIIVSEEGEGSASCPPNQWMSSIRTTGKFSDNMHFKCAGVNKGSAPLKWGDSYKAGPFSDETYRNIFSCPRNMAMTAINCKDSYCDNMWFECTAFQQ